MTIFACALSALAAPPYITHTTESDWQQTQSLEAIELQQGASVQLRERLTTGGKYLDLTGLTARWEGRSSITSTQALQVTSTLTQSNSTPHYFQFDLDSTETGTPVTNWVWSLIVVSAGEDYVIGTGELDIVESAWTGASAILTNITTQTAIDASIATHAADVDAHHARYTDAEALAAAIAGGCVTSAVEYGTSTFTNNVRAAQTNDGYEANTDDQTAAEVTATGTYANVQAALNALGNAAYSDTNDFASAAQGALADSALQAEADTLASVVARGDTAGADIEMAGTNTIKFTGTTGLVLRHDSIEPDGAADYGYAAVIDEAAGLTTWDSGGTVTMQAGDRYLYGNWNATSVTTQADAYDSGWNGDNTVPTKNDVYDKIETLGTGGGGFPVTLDEWYDMDLQDPSAAPHRAWSDGGGNTVYARALESTNTVNLSFDFRVVTGAAVTVTSPLAWETGTNQTASVICNIKYAYDDTVQASVTNTTGTLGTLATATQGEETIVNAWTNTIGTGHYRFEFDKGDSVVAYGELGFMGAPTITVTEP